jgi:hypothetical protein
MILRNGSLFPGTENVSRRNSGTGGRNENMAFIDKPRKFSSQRRNLSVIIGEYGNCPSETAHSSRRIGKETRNMIVIYLYCPQHHHCRLVDTVDSINYCLFNNGISSAACRHGASNGTMISER